MKYQGSKDRYAKFILPIIQHHIDECSCYIEPFVGGANMIDKVHHNNKIGADNNKYLISMFNGLKDDLERPYTISKELYSKCRTQYRGKEDYGYSDFMIGWVGFMASYNGRFYDGGYSGHCAGKQERDYISEQIRNTEKQLINLTDITFVHSSYSDLDIPKNSVIYCDPPYKGTKQYDTSKTFNHEHFWEWCRIQSRKGHKVFISEYNAPNDFECIWEKEVKNTMNQTKTIKATEKLFVYKGNNK